MSEGDVIQTAREGQNRRATKVIKSQHLLLFPLRGKCSNGRRSQRMTFCMNQYSVVDFSLTTVRVLLDVMDLRVLPEDSSVACLALLFVSRIYQIALQVVEAPLWVFRRELKEL
jgi:hypothetical protein